MIIVEMLSIESSGHRLFNAGPFDEARTEHGPRGSTSLCRTSEEENPFQASVSDSKSRLVGSERIVGRDMVTVRDSRRATLAAVVRVPVIDIRRWTRSSRYQRRTSPCICFYVRWERGCRNVIGMMRRNPRGAFAVKTRLPPSCAGGGSESLMEDQGYDSAIFRSNNQTIPVCGCDTDAPGCDHRIFKLV